MYQPCDFCKRTPSNKEDHEWGGKTDRPDGTRGWACHHCFPAKYYPQLEWEIPGWASTLPI